jgi:hypothetical protein
VARNLRLLYLTTSAVDCKRNQPPCARCLKSGKSPGSKGSSRFTYGFSVITEKGFATSFD